MLRLLALSGLTALAAAFVGAASAGAQAPQQQLLPNVTYEKGVQFTPHGPVALHIVRGPRPVGLYRLRPVLSNEAVLNRETVSSMQKRLVTQSTSVGVNGDFFARADGRPSGITLRDGVLVTPPNPARSSVGVQLDGTLDVRRVGFRGTWRGTGQRRSINFLNKEPGRNGISLFTSDWGTATPRVAGSYTVVLSPFPPATPNTDISAVVTTVVQNAPVAIPAGTAVLVARGSTAARLQAEAEVGTTVTLRLILQPDWASVSDAIGGGPLLVREGAPVYRANEAFTTSQLAPRGPRTAIGQTGDGRLLFVATDGRQPGYSVGMTNFELAQTLVRLGAVRGMALDGGGSSTLAFEGKVLNSPSDGRERSVSNALMLQYFGVYAPPPAEAVMSPNGDSVGESQALAYKVVRPSEVTVTLSAPDGNAAFTETVPREPGRLPGAVPAPRRADDAGGHDSGPDRSRRRPLVAQRHGDRRPGALVELGAALLGEHDPRLPATPAGAVGAAPARRERHDPLDADARGAREGDRVDARGHPRPGSRVPPVRGGRAVGGLERAAGEREARGGRSLRRARRGDERARDRYPRKRAHRPAHRPEALTYPREARISRRSGVLLAVSAPALVATFAAAVALGGGATRSNTEGRAAGPAPVAQHHDHKHAGSAAISGRRARTCSASRRSP